MDGLIARGTADLCRTGTVYGRSRFGAAEGSTRGKDTVQGAEQEKHALKTGECGGT